MPQATTPIVDANTAPPNDYLVEETSAPPRTPFITQMLRVLRIFILIVLAAISFGLFWVVGTMLGIF